MGINLQGERYFVSLPRMANPKQFKRMMASQLPNDLKDYLKSIEARLHQFQTECIQTGKPFTMDAIKVFIKSGYTSHPRLHHLHELMAPSIEVMSPDQKINLQRDYQS